MHLFFTWATFKCYFEVCVNSNFAFTSLEAQTNALTLHDILRRCSPPYKQLPKAKKDSKHVLNSA